MKTGDTGKMPCRFFGILKHWRSGIFSQSKKNLPTALSNLK